jgi:hypothetical protein
MPCTARPPVHEFTCSAGHVILGPLGTRNRAQRWDVPGDARRRVSPVSAARRSPPSASPRTTGTNPGSCRKTPAGTPRHSLDSAPARIRARTDRSPDSAGPARPPDRANTRTGARTAPPTAPSPPRSGPQKGGTAASNAATAPGTVRPGGTLQTGADPSCSVEWNLNCDDCCANGQEGQWLFMRLRSARRSASSPLRSSPDRACGSRAPLKENRPASARRATGGCPAPVPRAPGVRRRRCARRCANSRTQPGTQFSGSAVYEKRRNGDAWRSGPTGCGASHFAGCVSVAGMSLLLQR